MLVFNFILGLLIIVTAVLWAQMTGRHGMLVDPWDIHSNVCMLQSPFQWCVGQRRDCNGVSGAASVWAPILLNNTWQIDQTASGAVRISGENTAMVYLKSSGNIVVGPDELPGQSGVIVSLVPTAYTATPMWNSHAKMAFSDGSMLDSVCHVSDASMCGTLFRSSVLDAGIFTSKSRTVVGAVEYGFIAANLQARVILNASMVIAHYIDRGTAAPCCSNDTTLRCPTPTNNDLRNAVKMCIAQNATGACNISVPRFRGPPNNWTTTGITDMSFLFNNQTSFDTSIDSWDVSAVTDMSGIFYMAAAFNQPLTWNTSAVRDMGYMFAGATSFDQTLDWNTSAVENMNSMFAGATSFNQTLTWNTSAVIDTSYMFYGVTNFNQPLNWDTSAVTNMYGMFAGAEAFNQPLNWTTSAVENMNSMFTGATSFNQPLNWDTSAVTNMYGMFQSAESFDQTLTWNTSAVENMNSMFASAGSFNQPLTWNTSAVRDMGYMFESAVSFNNDITSWNCAAVINESSVFDGAIAWLAAFTLKAGENGTLQKPSRWEAK